jgi:hypothetical protein
MELWSVDRVASPSGGALGAEEMAIGQSRGAVEAVLATSGPVLTAHYEVPYPRPGVFQGMAVVECYNSASAQVVAASVADDGELTIQRFCCAIDPVVDYEVS